jgi:hypothetical protein
MEKKFKLSAYEKKEAKQGNLELENELEERLFSTWLESSDSEVGIGKKDIRNYIIEKVVDEKKRQELFEQLRQISDERLFNIFSIGDAV